MSRPILTDNLARDFKIIGERVKDIETRVTRTQLDTDQLYQFKSGAEPGKQSAFFNNTSGQITMLDSLDQPMQITITPPAAGLWTINAWSLWDSPDDIWSFARWNVILNPTDADNYATKIQGSVTVRAGTSYQQSIISNSFRLLPGTTYTATMRALFSSNNNQVYWQGAPHLGLEGQFRLF